MTDDRKDGLKSLENIFILAASIVTLVPGFSIFLSLPPPYLSLPGAAPIKALAAAIILIVFAWPQSSSWDGGSVKQYKRRVLLAFFIVIVSLFLTIAYNILYHFTTVSPPVPAPTVTCQTGFGMIHLTESAKKFILKRPAMANPRDLMFAFAAYAGCRTDLIWERWSISVAGTALIVLLIAASLLWAFGFALLARLLRGPRRVMSKKKATVATIGLAFVATTLTSCMSERLPSGHATTAERIKRLEAKARELDDKVASRESPPPKRKEDEE